LALDDLFRQGVEIRHVTVLHTDPAQPRIGEALDTVKAELPRAYGDRLSLKLVPICLHDTPIADVTTPEEARAVLRAIYVTVSDLKQAGATVHLCAAGGRKAMRPVGVTWRKTTRFGEEAEMRCGDITWPTAPASGCE
jgi:CRISPR-associated protein (TIGR02584 family)